ncbi:MAG: hypothetical protein IT170_00445, partial [Bryobacterales bacterium]|nr:hypothetical protein [Bryobacterales bacterium]
LRGSTPGSDVAACFSGKTSVTYIIPPERSVTEECETLPMAAGGASALA